MYEPTQNMCYYYVVRPFYPDNTEGSCGTEEYSLDAFDTIYVYNVGLGTGRLNRL